MAVTPWPSPQDGAPERADPTPHLRWPVRLTRAGMVAESLVRSFWPFWTVLLTATAPWLMGWPDQWPVELVWGGLVVSALAGLASLAWGLWRFRWPTRAEAVARVDARLPGRPIATLSDTQAIGAADPDSRAVWAAHLARMAARTKDAKAQPPDLALATRDTYGLRYMALLVFAVALLFGGFWRAGATSEAPVGEAATLTPGPTWEGWIEPPAYTGLPTLYLADQPAGALAIPQGSEVTIRFYGDPGALILDETVSGRTEDPGAASAAAHDFTVTGPGRLAIQGPGGVDWQVSVLPDAPPVIAFNGEIAVEAQGPFTQPFTATDDFGVTGATATITLDLPQVPRRHGLATEPEPREPLVLDLPMPFTGDRTEIAEALAEDLSQYAYANLPVTLTLTATDALGQQGQTEAKALILPGRRFFQPVARSVIELRRDLLWSRENAPRVVRLLRAISHRPEGFFTDETIYLRLRFTLRQLAAHVDDDTLTPEATEEIAVALWDLAVLLEEGTLADARERLRRAQEMLAEAMRNGASPEEIAELMQELREATDDYLRMLAQNAEPAENTTDEPQTGQQQGGEVTQDQIQALMDQIQQLMEEGRMAEAQELMEQLNELMENLQLQMTENGQGGFQTPGEQSMEELGETLREQQELSDEAFRDLQEQFNGQPGEQQQPGQQAQEGQQQGQEGQGLGQGGDPQDGQTGDQGQGGEGDLADRQQALRDELERQRGELPGLTGEEAQAAREALERAEGAMDRAEEALEQGDLAEAIDNQAEAMDALREGLRNLGRALAENQAQELEDQEMLGEGQGRTEPARRDPLGRQLGEAGQFGTDQNMVPGEDVYRRAQELLEELRRRSGEQDRPTLELDYLRRLLERF